MTSDRTLITVEEYPTGWKLHSITIALLSCAFLAQMESTITSTSVITITDDLGDYLKSSWILTAYWLTAGAFQIIWAKISDIVGRKTAIITSLSIFTVFSGVCGASQNVIQLIMFRWLQGIGGCRILALGQLVFFELVPPEKYPPYIALGTTTIASALIIGPLIGGGITVHGNWRWVFLMNVPVGVVAILALIWIFPKQLSHEPAAHQDRKDQTIFSLASFKRVDFLGCTLLLGSCLLLTTSLEQAAVGYDFTSPFVLPLLVISGPFIVAFLVHSWFITTRRENPEPVFPWRFCQTRARIGIILATWLNGAVLSTCVVQIPQRYITVNDMTPFEAAARLLAFGAFVPTGSSLAVLLMKKLRLSPFIFVGIGASLQVIGTVLLARVSSSYSVQPWQYGVQILIGTGVGIVISALLTLLPVALETQDIAVGTAALSQFRMLGGLIAVAIGATITTRYLKSELIKVVSPELAGLLLQRTETMRLLSGAELESVRSMFGEAYNRQMYIAVGMSVAQIPVTALLRIKQSPEDETATAEQIQEIEK